MLDDGRTLLVTHLSKKNAQCEDLRAGTPVLALFQGPHAFITPSWYVKQRTFPAWHYTAIHARGRPRLIEDRSTTHAVLRRTVAQYDTPLGGHWDFDAMDYDFMVPRPDMIAALETEVQQLTGKFKLNQDRSQEDRYRVIAALEAPGVAVAALMRRQLEVGQAPA